MFEFTIQKYNVNTTSGKHYLQGKFTIIQNYFYMLMSYTI